MSNLLEHAKRELHLARLAHVDPNVEDDQLIVDEYLTEILDLIAKFDASGGTAYEIANAVTGTLNVLLKHDILTPLTGEDDEWKVMDIDPDNPITQNIRKPSVFLDDKGAYYLDAIIWHDETGNYFTGTVEGIRSRQYIKEFPFTPKPAPFRVVNTPYNKEIHEGYSYYENEKGELICPMIHDDDREVLGKILSTYRQFDEEENEIK
jgi:hypothetical protein